MQLFCAYYGERALNFIHLARRVNNFDASFVLYGKTNVKERHALLTSHGKRSDNIRGDLLVADVFMLALSVRDRVVNALKVKK